MSKPKLFLSYGRRDSETVALRMKNDLEAAGYEVWMDRSEIKAGTAWSQAIEQALDRSQAVVALLSPHSVRTTVEGAKEDSVCLDELARARDCPGKILPVMVADCRVPLILYRLHCVDLRSWQKCEADYQTGLQSILQGIEATLRNEVRYRSSSAKLQPWDFTPFLAERRRGFVGRHWLFKEVQSWLEGTHHESCLLIAGDPGIGKSAFVGQWVHLNPGGRLLAYHCCQIDSKKTLQPYCFVSSLAAMIASQLPEYEALLQNTQDTSVSDALKEEACREDPVRGFEAGILAPLHRITAPPDGVRCILIDALDEAVLIKEDDSIVQVLAACLGRLPSWLRVVCTTRKDPEVLKKLARLRAAQLDAQDLRNTADAMAYLSARFQSEPLATLAREAKLSLPKVIDLLLDRSKGNFLYLHYALDGLVLNSYHLDRPDEFPPGLPGFYEKAFHHRFRAVQDYAPAAAILAAVLAAHEPLDLSLLMATSGAASPSELNRTLKSLAIYLPERDGTYSLFHRSLAEWLRDSRNNEDYCIEPIQGERKLAEVGWAEYLQKRADMCPYMIRYLPHHLAATGQWEHLAQLLTDFAILAAAWKAGREHEWMRFWRQLMDRVDMVKAYRKSIDRLLAQHADRPQIAQVTGQVGTLLRNLGLPEQALPFALNAVELLRAAGPAHRVALATALLDLAETRRHLRDFDAAEPIYEEALQLRETIFNPDSAEVGDVVHAMCVHYNTCTKRDIDKAIQLNERAIRIRERFAPPNYAALADALNDKAVLLSAKGRHEEVLPYYLRSRELFEQAFPDGHPELGVVLSNIGGEHSRSGDLEQAIEYHLLALKMRSMFVVPYDEKCQGFRRDLMQAQLKLGRHQEAFQWAQQVFTSSSGDPHCNSHTKLLDLFNLTCIAALAKQPAECDRSMALFQEEMGKIPDNLLETAWDLFAELHLRLISIEFSCRQFAAARELFDSGRRTMLAQQPPPVKALANYYRTMSEIMGQIDQPEIERQLAEAADSFDTQATRRIPQLMKLAQANDCISQDNLSGIRSLVEELFAEARQMVPADPEWLKLLSVKANELALRSKNEKNDYALTEWLYEQGRALDPNNATLAANYAFFLTSVLQRHDKAEELYRSALAINSADANCLSNYAVFHTHVKRDWPKAESLFAQAHALSSPYIDSILGNYAALRIVCGDLDGARQFARQSYEACLPHPDRMMTRPLFCAATIAALRGADVSPYLAQLKSLFLSGIHRVPWQVDALIEHLAAQLPPDSCALLKAVFAAICSRSSDTILDQMPAWSELRPMPFDKPWPE